MGDPQRILSLAEEPEQLPEAIRGALVTRLRAHGDTMALGAAAEVLGISTSTLRRWGEQGRLRALRTEGGHRRFLVEEVRRLNAGRVARRGVQLRRVDPPSTPLPALARLLDAHGLRLTRAACRALYVGSKHGWFGREDATNALDRWLAALAFAARTGSYDAAVEASLVFDDRARLGGATLFERSSFVEWVGEAALRALAAGDSGRAEAGAARRLFVALRHAVVMSERDP